MQSRRTPLWFRCCCSPRDDGEESHGNLLPTVASVGLCVVSLPPLIIFSPPMFFSPPGLLLTSASKTPSAPSSSDFLSFSDSALRSGGGTTFSSPPSFSSCLVKPCSEGGASEGTTALFGSMMSTNTASAGTRCLFRSEITWVQFKCVYVI